MKTFLKTLGAVGCMAFAVSTATTPAFAAVTAPGGERAIDAPLRDCASALREAERRGSEGAAPQSADLIPQLQAVLWMLDLHLAALDEHCRSEPDYERQRASFQDSRNQSMTVCRQLATNQNDCRPQPYRR